ncbi:glycosyltransferase [Hymenobacter cellulosilyticus]|uniref:Glycosyltransferase n=1 Tax=Hymenobacter cellulosilyticus TaxID=2932248 RepID=A0A8T9QHZ9_9BACT|nr:glycosyltransferase [Hymenobacter cellulosilyticus]UOQ74423.1 glycosyltransferase [Hymenobacter cellulosilyticus]
METQPQPMVSVMMITYNHAPYLPQALDSILMQERDFSLEIVIGEDCSPDNTRAIVLDYQRRYPDIIRPLLPEKNIGAMNNQVQVMEACRGRYVAVLEGDDYWTDPRKLQRQVDYLNAHPEAALVFTDCSLVDEQGQIIQEHYVPARAHRNYNLRELLQEYCPPTLTVLYRNVVPTMPLPFRKVTNGDYALFSLIAEHGTLNYLPGITAHYRRHGGGVWSSQNQEKQFRNNLNTGLVMLNYFGPEYYANLMPVLNWYYTQLCALLWQQKRYKDFWQLYRDFASVSMQTKNKELPAFTLKLLTGRLPKSTLHPA